MNLRKSKAIVSIRKVLHHSIVAMCPSGRPLMRQLYIAAVFVGSVLHNVSLAAR